MKIALLSDRQVQKLHRASTEILETIGVHVPHPAVLDLFREAGEAHWVEDNLQRRLATL